MDEMVLLHCSVVPCSLHMTFLLIAYVARPQWIVDIHSTRGLLLPLPPISMLTHITLRHLAWQ